MNIPKRIIGKEVRIRWVDPRALRLESHFPEDHKDVPFGEAGLAVWEEWGRIEKIEEKVVYLLQGIAKDPPGEPRQHEDIQYSIFPEGLVKQLVVLGEIETLSEEKKPGVE